MNQKLAAIDIGSNAIRMAIARYDVQSGLELIKKYRFPIRLGSDVFDKGEISDKNIKISTETFKKFKQLTEKYKIKKIRAVGTSALREAKNQKQFVELIEKKSDIKIEIIDGVVEAQLVHLAVKKNVQLEGHNALLIDVGGGSIELTFSEKSFMSATQSFPFGTVRTLGRLKKKQLTEEHINTVIGEYLHPISQFIESHSIMGRVEFAIGTGGNLEALGKLKSQLLGSRTKNMVSYHELTEMIGKLRKMKINERIQKLGMRPDRADVILPACLVVQAVMRLSQLERLVIPHVGLKDGLLWSLVQEPKT